ncbi:MAG TPA: glycosyltransferase [Chitinophagaceae bacterium]
MWPIISIAVITVFTVCYATLILFYRQLFLRLRPFFPPDAGPTTRFSVIIPARNESLHIAGCVRSVYRQDYPRELFEVVVVDDHSTDDTAAIVKQLQSEFSSLKLVRLQDALQGRLLNAYKKKAIATAIPQSSGDWIITTDADCRMTSSWLRCYDAFIREQDPMLVAGPVRFINNGSFVSVFQCLDFLSLQGITAAAVSAGQHSMCNGANLAYRRSAFSEVNGFTGIDHIASGDDMLLMHKIRKRYPGRTAYLFAPGAVVSTTPMPDWISFFNQRIRWASKAERYDDRSIIAVLVLVYFYNLLLLVFAVLSFVDSLYLELLLGSLVVKTVAELSFMIPVAEFYKEKKLLWWFPLMQPFHIVYMVVAGWLGKFGSYRWKGRKVK